jgi:hypothetical protein
VSSSPIDNQTYGVDNPTKASMKKTSGMTIKHLVMSWDHMEG